MSGIDWTLELLRPSGTTSQETCVEFAVEILRGGAPLSPAIREAIADLIEPKTRGRPRSAPTNWSMIAYALEDGLTISEAARACGMSYQDAYRCAKYVRSLKGGAGEGIIEAG